MIEKRYTPLPSTLLPRVAKNKQTNEKQNKPHHKHTPPDSPFLLLKTRSFWRHARHLSVTCGFSLPLSARFRAICLSGISPVCPVFVLLTVHTPELAVTGSDLEGKEKFTLSLLILPQIHWGRALIAPSFLKYFRLSFCHFLIEKPHACFLLATYNLDARV